MQKLSGEMQKGPEAIQEIPGLQILRNGGLGLRRQLNCEIRQTNDAEPILDFIASDASVDRYNEVIEPGGWQLDNYRKNPVVVDSHDYSSITRILGISVSIEVKDGKLLNRVRFSTDNPMGNMAYKMARTGFIRSESPGFIPIEWIRGNEAAGEPYRTYKKQELIEISLVAIPANPAATIPLALKTGAITRGDLSQLSDYLKLLCNDTAGSTSDASASGRGADEAQLLALTRDIQRMLKYRA
jgi:HK97 family phage prohead protease